MDLLWRLHPNGGKVAAVSIGVLDGLRLLERGWLTVCGQRAVVSEYMGVENRGRIALRVVFDEPFTQAHP